MPRLKIDYRIDVNASQQDVYDYVSDFSRHGEWAEGLKVEPVSDGPLAVGSEYRSVGKQLGKDASNSLKITEYDPPIRMSFVASDGKVEFLNELDFQSQNGGTLLKRRLSFDTNPILFVMFKSLIGP